MRTHEYDGESPLHERVGIPAALDETSSFNERLADLIKLQLAELGEDPGREGLLKTPERVSRSLEFLTSGYTMNVSKVINDALFESDTDEMVIEKDINFFSLCEHHLLPFYGVAHVAYIPNGKVIGLSKMARVVDVFARRLQIQERMTQQIALSLEEALNPRGVGVVIEGIHLCMTMRGVQKPGSKTMTSAMLGDFKADARTRSEFLALIRGA